MSRSIWTRCAGPSEVRRLSGAFRRVVEDQSRNSTRKLLDSDAEQAVLEELLETHAKLPVPEGFRHLHFLLFTPFRHPPLRNGSRFGTRRERGILYGARKLETAFAEVAPYRLLFLEGTSADLGAVTVGLRGERLAELGAVTTTSIDALKAYLEGRSAYRANDLFAAQQAFERAVQASSIMQKFGLDRATRAAATALPLSRPGRATAR